MEISAFGREAQYWPSIHLWWGIVILDFLKDIIHILNFNLVYLFKFLAVQLKKINELPSRDLVKFG